MTESELYHHGIKGQKWGVRRFQNPDGTLTAAGKKHVAQRSSGSKFNSSGGTDLTQVGSSGGGGGGGGAPLDEEDQKKIEEMWEEMAKLDGYEFPNRFDGEFLAELGEAGIDTENLSDEQVGAMYKKAKEAYDKTHNPRLTEQHYAEEKEKHNEELRKKASGARVEEEYHGRDKARENATDILNPIHKGKEKAKESSKTVQEGKEKKQKMDRDVKKDRTIDDFYSTGSRSMGSSHTVSSNPGNEDYERKKKEQAIRDAEYRKRTSGGRPTSRKKYVTEATGTVKRRGSAGTGKVGHSFQAPSESELYHCFGPLFQTEEKIEYSASELYHHGIKGQKWGVRRFQNEDGTLTEAGKKRDAKRIQKDLNALDNEWAFHKGEYDKWYKKSDKMFTKAGKVGGKIADEKVRETGDNSDASYYENWDNGVEKYYDEHRDKADLIESKTSKAYRSMKDIESRQWKKIGEAHSKGYMLNSKPTYRYTSKGANVASQFGLIGMATYHMTTGKALKTKGQKFKVKAK